MNKRELSKNVLIIGQGIAGSMLAWKLEKRNISFCIVSNGLQNTCSYLAAGLINPVTGRKYVKSWLTDELFSELIKSYTQIEKEIDCNILTKVTFLRDFSNPGEENRWISRCEDANYSSYIGWRKSEYIQGARFNTTSIHGLTYGYKIDTHQLLTKLRQRWLERGDLIESKWNETIDIKSGNIHFNGEKFSDIVFCTGSNKTTIDYFDNLPLIPNAGEFIQVHIPDFHTKYLLKRHKVLVPLRNKEFWFGATYDWNCKSLKPTVEGRTKLIEALEDFISCPYTLINHHLGVRPTVKDRRPLIGSHFEAENIHLFNGFGTKGYSLVPYWSNKFLDYMINGNELHPEVNINRFADK